MLGFSFYYDSIYIQNIPGAIVKGTNISHRGSYARLPLLDEGVDFMLGDSLLVANVVEKGEKVREVYLPKDEVFYDFYTRTAYQGGQRIQVPVELGSIPLFVRGGGLIPMAVTPMDNLKTQRETELCMLCADDHDGEFFLYEDDGISMEYQNGDYRKTRIKMESGLRTRLAFINEGAYQTKVERINIDMIHREKAPFEVWVEGSQVPQLNRKSIDTTTNVSYNNGKTSR